MSPAPPAGNSRLRGPDRGRGLLRERSPTGLVATACVHALEPPLVGGRLQRGGAVRTQRDRNIRQLGPALGALHQTTGGIGAGGFGDRFCSHGDRPQGRPKCTRTGDPNPPVSELSRENCQQAAKGTNGVPRGCARAFAAPPRATTAPPSGQTWAPSPAEQSTRRADAGAKRSAPHPGGAERAVRTRR